MTRARIETSSLRVALGVCAKTAALAATMIGSATAASPSTLFKPGYNLCKAASLAAIGKAGGQTYQAGRFDGHVCNWERKDLKAGITLSLFKGAAAAAMRTQIGAVHGSASGPGGLKMTSVHAPGASAAVLETLPAVVKGEASKALFAVYPQGIVHVNMTAPGSLPTTRLLAVLAAVTKP